jgi:DNA-binding transcriptional MerR regulator
MRASALMTNVPGITMDHLHNWERQGYLAPTKTRVGKKQVRDYSEREVTFIKIMWFYYRKGLSPKNAHKSAREELAKSSSSALSPLNDHRDDHEIPEREADSLEGIAIFELSIPLKSYFHVKKGDQRRRWALAT